MDIRKAINTGTIPSIEIILVFRIDPSTASPTNKIQIPAITNISADTGGTNILPITNFTKVRGTDFSKGKLTTWLQSASVSFE